ncbi:diaminopimelate decarboxylase [Sphaerisporangium sp. TRM90804]|nr:diaminopimelate decarboxylase [Sphaerisporangium sp. TRM90804]
MRSVARPLYTDHERPSAAPAFAGAPDGTPPWSATTRFHPGGDATMGGVSLTAIAARFGTPAYVVDETDVRMRCRAYRAALPGAEVAYAGKAFLCRAMASWVRSEGLSLDVCSSGELAVAAAAGFPAERVIMHGNAKTPQELAAALEYGVGRIVVDDVAEISRLAALTPPGQRRRVLVRVIPDVEAGGHAAVRTGGEDQKFGLSIATGAAGDAVGRVLGQPCLELAGLHCHLGSQIIGTEPFTTAVVRMIDQLALVRDVYGVTPPQLNIGGGHGIVYETGGRALDLRRFAAAVTGAVESRCAELDLPVPRLTVEPGRALSGPAGVTLYRVIAVKRGLNRTYVSVDGGMSDNPRPALYGARHEVRLVGRAAGGAVRACTVAGHHCEAGDLIARDVPLPEDVHPGDLLAVAATGAYNHSMASTYNQTGRPPVVAVSQGAARLVVRRELTEDLLRRDVGL